MSKIDDKIIIDNTQELTSNGQTFDFLNEDKDIYSESVLKEKF